MKQLEKDSVWQRAGPSVQKCRVGEIRVDQMVQESSEAGRLWVVAARAEP